MLFPVDGAFATWGIAGLATAGVIARPFRWPEAIWAVAGALALVAFGLLPWADAVDHIVGAGECRHRGGTCARPAISSTSCPRAIGVAGSEFVLDLGLRGSAQLGPRWFTKTLLVELRQSYLSTQTVAHATAASTDQRMRLFALRSAP